MEPAKPLPSSDLIPQGKFDDATTSKSAYIPLKAEPTKSFKPDPANTNRASVPFSGISTYNDSFILKQVPAFSLHKPKNDYEPSKEKFMGSTTHKDAFTTHAYGPAKPVYAMPSTTLEKSLPFQGQSTMHADFIKKEVNRTAQYRPVGEAVKTGPFQGLSSYKTDYTPKEIPFPYRRQTDCSECSSCADDDEFVSSSRPY